MTAEFLEIKFGIGPDISKYIMDLKYGMELHERKQGYLNQIKSGITNIIVTIDVMGGSFSVNYKLPSSLFKKLFSKIPCEIINKDLKEIYLNISSNRGECFIFSISPYVGTESVHVAEFEYTPEDQEAMCVYHFCEKIFKDLGFRGRNINMCWVSFGLGPL